MMKLCSLSLCLASCMITPLAFGQSSSGEPSLDLLSTDSPSGSNPSSGVTVVSDVDPWRVNLNTWAWLTSLDGTMGVRNREADVDASFGDIIDESDSIAAFSGRLEIGYNRWGVFVDGIVMDLGADDQSGPAGLADIDVTIEMALIDFGLMYRLGTWEPEGAAAANRADITLDLYAGARYTDMEVELDPADLASASRSESWFDPIVGAKLVLPLAERWRFQVLGDVGGFGVESDFTWATTAALGYEFKLFDMPAMVFLGYRAIGQDYSTGSGADQFTWDMIQHGPLLGFSILF